MKLNKVILTVLVMIFALSNIVILYSMYNQSLSPSLSSAASDGKYLLNLISPTSLSNATVNSTVTIGLYAQNTTDVTAGEIVLSYDPTVIEGVQMVEDSNILLALNKKIDNNSGKITIDIAYVGSGFLPADTTLVRFDFKVVNNSKNGTSVSLASGSTLGIPNKLSISGMGSLPINFGSVVQPQPICGNGVKESSEQCDDGNLNNGDGCSSSCRTESTTPPSNNNPPTNTNPNNTNNTNNNTDNTNDQTPNTPDNTSNDPTVPDTNVQISDDSVTTTTTNSTPRSNNNSVAPTDNRNLLTVLLIITISGTLASLFFLIRELFAKKEEPNANPFM